MRFNKEDVEKFLEVLNSKVELIGYVAHLDTKQERQTLRVLLTTINKKKVVIIHEIGPDIDDQCQSIFTMLNMSDRENRG